MPGWCTCGWHEWHRCANGGGVNVDGVRGVGVRGANVDWGVNAGACSGWSEGQGEQCK